MAGIGALVNKGLGVMGLQLSKVPPKVSRPVVKPFDQAEATRQIDGLKKDPTNAALHLTYAEFNLVEKRPIIAYAELRTASFLGSVGPVYEAIRARVEAASPPLVEMSHNVYVRLYTLAKAIKAQGTGLSVLDVGGGTGGLAPFLPENAYCLAEPWVNGISGENLPFPDGTFDLVVSCHVLEHIPAEGRDAFLDELMSKAKKAVILLNPFFDEKADERLQFHWDEWQLQWAKEHMDCRMPRTEEVMDYAERRGYQCVMTPNAHMSTSFLDVWIDALMDKKELREKWRRLNRFLNTRMMENADSDPSSTIFLCVLTRK